MTEPRSRSARASGQQMPPRQQGSIRWPSGTTSVLGDALLDSDELAAYLKLPVGTLDQWASRGGGPPFHKVGRHRRYAPADVKAWLAGSRRDDDPAA
jgi:excisionase family DNA binding protein